jgi:hypothetical protein
LGLAEGAVAAQHGYGASRIACLPWPTFTPEYHTLDRLDRRAPERALELCSQLIEKIDETLVEPQPQ